MVPSSVRLRGHDSSEGWPSVGWEGEGVCLMIREQFLFPSFDGMLEPFPAGICYPHRDSVYRSSPCPAGLGVASPAWPYFRTSRHLDTTSWVPPESPRCSLSFHGPLTSKPLSVLPSTSQDPRSLDGETDLLRPSQGLFDMIPPSHQNQG